VLDLRADRSLAAFDGAPGRWSVEASGERAVLRMVGEGRVANLEVQLIANDEVHLRNTDQGTNGAVMIMQRCR
jgi:hypothetical protein